MEKPTVEVVESFTVAGVRGTSKVLNALASTIAEHNKPGTTLVITVHAWRGLREDA